MFLSKERHNTVKFVQRQFQPERKSATTALFSFQTDQSYYQHHGDRVGRTNRTNREKTRRNRTGRGDIDDPRTSGGTSEMNRRKRGENHKSGQCIMEALYDYDPHIYSPNVDVEVDVWLFKVKIRIYYLYKF